MKNRTTIRHGMMADFRRYLRKSGWELLPTKGEYEVLRAVKKGCPRPLIVYDRSTGGCGYSIDERDVKVYSGWKRNRSHRGLSKDFPEFPYCGEFGCEGKNPRTCLFNEYGFCTRKNEEDRRQK